MSESIYEKEATLKVKGTFYKTKEGNSAFKSKEGVKFFWMQSENYNEWLQRIINSL